MKQRTLSKLRVLDFDIENRPLSYLGQDFTTGEITAIAWQFIGEPKTLRCMLLGEVELPELLQAFVADYNRADVVTGHYIRKHDLPVISGALLEQGMAPLSEKRTQDTKLDLVRAKHLSMSQESLSAMLGVKAPKIHMTQPGWREANRLTKEGLRRTRERVVGDVKQHMELRRKLIEMGVLGPGKVWRP